MYYPSNLIMYFFLVGVLFGTYSNHFMASNSVPHCNQLNIPHLIKHIGETTVNAKNMSNTKGLITIMSIDENESRG